jgi:hypothetical protein
MPAHLAMRGQGIRLNALMNVIERDGTFYRWDAQRGNEWTPDFRAATRLPRSKAILIARMWQRATVWGERRDLR